MAWYRAAGNISHGSPSKGDIYCPKGSVVELPEGESKSDLFVLCDPPPGHAPAPPPVVDESPAPVPVEYSLASLADALPAPAVEKVKPGKRK